MAEIAPYEQVCQAIIEKIRAGELVAGARIPTVRELAAEIGRAPNTVARAYEELKKRGVIETRGRGGSFIASTGDPVLDEAGRAAGEFATVMRKLGIAQSQALALVTAAFSAS
ncbi:GntR family transcriptional regulator [Smaragdicoccus niigatensis]|uniref:GntR family transcriptional regulator n=1 Tax=Smaragdicoccus niigatensis TaxID=359359 RepID=UPI000375F610|nr:GntR family transcriptional regulator [Smaragdicoccus niigatensis]